MKERDNYKEKAKAMANVEVGGVSSEQENLWNKYKQLRNKINNRIDQEEIKYKKNKIHNTKDNPGLLWGMAKNFMSWSSPGPPTQLEVKEGNSITLVTKASMLAKVMNDFFVFKVKTIVSNLRKLPIDLSGCMKIMKGRKLSISLKFITVAKVRKLLGSLKNKTSTYVDQPCYQASS